MRYLLIFSYDGSKFNGFQRQKDKKSVQGTIENNLSKLLNEEIIIKGSGRTDAGVHALRQCAHFDYNGKTPQNFKKLINEKLNEEIIIRKIKKVDKDFHARFSVKEKTYKYVINLDRSNKNDLYYYTIYKNIDLKLMKEAAKYFIGIHDFENFVSGKRDNYETYIKKIKINKKNNFIVFTFTGAGFYRYMIRHLVGALYDIGRGKLTIEELKKLIDKKVLKESSVLPAYGLYLVNIKY